MPSSEIYGPYPILERPVTIFSFPEIFITPLKTTIKEGIARSMIERMLFVLFVMFEKFKQQISKTYFTFDSGFQKESAFLQETISEGER